MALVVEEDVAANPADVALFGGVRVVAQAQLVAHLVEQLLGFGFHGGLLGLGMGYAPP
jgi:hypothetical protein